MKRQISAILDGAALTFYWIGFALLAVAHVYATVLAYHYVYAWKASRALFLGVCHVLLSRLKHDLLARDPLARKRSVLECVDVGLRIRCWPHRGRHDL